MIRRRWLLAALASWTLTPIAMLCLRALTQAWRFPEILPDVVNVGSALSFSGRDRLAAALLTSVGLALVTGGASTIAGFVIAKTIAGAAVAARRAALALALFTVIVPPIALGVGLQVALLSLGLGGTAAGVLLAHMVPATGYLTLFAVGIFSSADLSLDDEARTLGASRWQVWMRITIPMVRGRLAEAIVLGALVSWGQLALTLLIGGGVVRTLPLELLSLVQSGNDQLGSLAALLLSVPPLGAIGLLKVGTVRTGAGL